MKRYILRKYVMANSVMEAVQKERDTRIEPEDVWVDDKQPEAEEQPSQIGFDYQGDGYYYSPHLKKKRKKTKK